MKNSPLLCFLRNAPVPLLECAHFGRNSPRSPELNRQTRRKCDGHRQQPLPEAWSRPPHVIDSFRRTRSSSSSPSSWRNLLAALFPARSRKAVRSDEVVAGRAVFSRQCPAVGRRGNRTDLCQTQVPVWSRTASRIRLENGIRCEPAPSEFPEDQTEPRHDICPRLAT